MIITIDGFAGSGKSSTATLVAKKLGFKLLNTGAMYRCIGLYFLNNNLDPENLDDVQNILHNINLVVDTSSDKQQFFLNNANVTDEIFVDKVSQIAGKVAQIPEVRKFLHEIQRQIGSSGDFVFEGRDMGSVVFPDADFKFFINTSLDEKVRRRKLQLHSLDEIISEEELRKSITERDERDAKNTIKTSDMIDIKTDGKSLEEVAEEIYGDIVGDLR